MFGGRGVYATRDCLDSQKKVWTFFMRGGSAPPHPPLKSAAFAASEMMARSMGPGWLAGWLRVKLCLRENNLNRISKKKFCVNFVFTLYSTNPGDLLNRITLNPPPFYSIDPWELLNRMGVDPGKWYWILNRKNHFEDQGSFYSVIPRELMNRMRGV